MLAQSFTQGREDSAFSLMQKTKEQRVVTIRKAVSSDLSKEIENYKVRIKNNNSYEVEEMKNRSSLVVEEEEEEEELVEAKCSCCGIKEECTKSYILEVQKSFSGNKWVCGLCSEAVKERVLKFPNTTIDKALELHKQFCDSFNTTTRLNPKLSLTTSMRKIARKSFENRTHNTNYHNHNKLSRSVSCDPRIGLQD
ncbi:uncharacterized protein LOC116402862 [Cucumis sativus]|uniref:uncharacterized protein LOC116402862 n=1 Tax=Cucumis sativus TaxID=3659 RepID=UPI0012F51461|nr:uncharacterized protein LOC116402862 [Cucumis sativus]